MILLAVAQRVAIQDLPQQGKRTEGSVESIVNDNPETIMKFALVAAASLLACGAAYAQKIEVAVPADLTSPAAATAYTTALMEAIDTVCARETGPIIGVGYYTYRACVKQTRIDVSAQEPTGLLASRLNLTAPITLAAK